MGLSPPYNLSCLYCCCGLILSAWTKRDGTNDPLSAEASAVVWALEFASELNFQSVIVESDAKTCVDAVNCVSKDCNWKILNLCPDTQELAL